MTSRLASLMKPRGYRPAGGADRSVGDGGVSGTTRPSIFSGFGSDGCVNGYAPRSTVRTPVWVNPGRAVEDSQDLRRIAALPERPAFDDRNDYSALVSKWTERVRRPGGTMILRPVQAFCLEEAERTGGLTGLLAVGVGKTLLGLLLPVALSSRKAVILLPAQLKAQLLQRNFPELSKHFRIPNVVGASPVYPDTEQVIYVVSYSELSSSKTASVLETIQPDTVIRDEAHSLRNASAARTKRWRRYEKAARAVGTLKHVCDMSGTMATKTIRDLDLAKSALGMGTPVPRDYGTLQEWAWALDPTKGDDLPAPPGELLRLARPGESARAAFRRRLTTTPGVVATTSNPILVGLRFQTRPLALPANVAKTLVEMRRTWVTPWGEEIQDAKDFSRYARQIAAGLLYRRTWPNNEPASARTEWLEARAEWHREVRAFLARSSKPGMDSPKLVAAAAANGKRPSAAYDRWAAVKDLAKPATEPYWCDDFLVKDAIAWGRAHVGLIWYEHVALGARVAAEGGFVHVPGGEVGEAALAALDGTRTVVISRPSRGTGTDGLQRLFDKQLVTTTSSNGSKWEQLLGRLHRSGSTADRVTTWVYRHTPEMIDAFDAAVRDAAFLEETTGNEQKLNSADFDFPVAAAPTRRREKE